MEEAESATFVGACTLDHHGCVVCSDAGIPMRVITLEGDDASCVDAAGNEAVIAVELVQPVEVGEVVLTHGGVAIGRVHQRTREKFPSPLEGERPGVRGLY
jgi:hydrogenase maturation factor